MKIKKVLLGLFALSFFSFSSFTMISCSESSSDNSFSNSEEPPHVHEWVVDEVLVEAKCTSDGVTTYRT